MKRGQAKVHDDDRQDEHSRPTPLVPPRAHEEASHAAGADEPPDIDVDIDDEGEDVTRTGDRRALESLLQQAAAESEPPGSPSQQAAAAESEPPDDVEEPTRAGAVDVQSLVALERLEAIESQQPQQDTGSQSLPAGAHDEEDDEDDEAMTMIRPSLAPSASAASGGTAAAATEPGDAAESEGDGVAASWEEPVDGPPEERPGGADPDARVAHQPLGALPRRHSESSRPPKGPRVLLWRVALAVPVIAAVAWWLWMRFAG